MMKMKGFTLAELLIVIVILGILGGIALPRFYPQAEKARVAEAVSMLSAIRQGEMAYHLETGFYISPGANDWPKIGIENPNSNYWSYSVSNSTGSAGTATAKRLDYPTGTEYEDAEITLDINGTWGDGAVAHPNRPQN